LDFAAKIEYIFNVMGNRLKAPFLAIAFLFAGVCLPAQDDFSSFGDGAFNDGSGFPVLSEEPRDYPLAGEEKPETAQPASASKAKENIKDIFKKTRTWELSLLNVGLDLSNNFLFVSELFRDPYYILSNINKIEDDPGLIWKNPVVIDTDNLLDDIKFNFGSSIKPFSFNYYRNDRWGLGLDFAHIDITGNLLFSKNMITLSETTKDKFGVGGAIFVDAGVPVFFHLNEFKIKLRPSVYLPVLYTEPKVTYITTKVKKDKFNDEGKYIETVEGVRYDITYDMSIYSPVSMKNMDTMAQKLLDGLWDDPQHFGYDIKLNVEYPLQDDIDIGVDVVNIPFAGARLNHYMQLNGSVWVDTSEINFSDLTAGDEEMDMDYFKGRVFDYPESFTPEYKYNDDGKKIYRPFTMLFYAHCRFFESQKITLIPSLGFSISYLYPDIAAVEGGLSARFDAENFFSAILGINYNDRKWKNSLDFIFNMRAAELDLGISFQSQDFAKSWQGAGLGVGVALKFGW